MLNLSVAFSAYKSFFFFWGTILGNVKNNQFGIFNLNAQIYFTHLN